MADAESMVLEDGAVSATSIMTPPLAANVEFQAQLDDAVQVLSHRGQTSLAELALLLLRLRLRTAMWFLSDEVRHAMVVVEGDPELFDVFRLSIWRHIFNFQRIGYHDHVISGYFLPPLVLKEAQKHAARLVMGNDEATRQTYRDGGLAVVIHAAAAVVRSLESQTFHVAGGSDEDDGVTECSICLKEFVDGAQVRLMPCPSPCGHKFHPDCIAKWLAISDVCPLCRHELPASTSV